MGSRFAHPTQHLRWAAVSNAIPPGVNSNWSCIQLGYSGHIYFTLLALHCHFYVFKPSQGSLIVYFHSN